MLAHLSPAVFPNSVTCDSQIIWLEKFVSNAALIHFLLPFCVPPVIFKDLPFL